MGRIGVLILNKKIDRSSSKNKSFDDLLYMGLKIILSELKENYDFINSVSLKEYDFILCSLTSVMDVENLIFTLNNCDKGKAKIIVGGFGCINIRAYRHLIDIAVFGRADGQINDILSGVEFNNVWRKDKDPNLEGTYSIRQIDVLPKKESSIGCPNKCYFCQYTWTRKLIGNRYHHGNDLKTDEDDFKNLVIKKSGRYTTAFDGLSEKTRYAINKNWCKYIDIKNKIESIYNNNDIIKPINIKLFQIVGFPWENKKTFFDDLNDNKKLWGSLDKKNKMRRIIFMYFFTPFSPEPLTPMQYSKVSILNNWRRYLNNSCYNIYGDNSTDIEAFTLPQINSCFTLAKRVLINRCTDELAPKLNKVILSCVESKNNSDVLVKSLINYIGADLFEELDPNNAGFNYLKTYLNILKFCGLAEKKYYLKGIK